MMHWLYRLADELRHRARLRRGPQDQAWGRRGEDLAHRFLQRNGFTVVARNYRAADGSGELDLVAWEGDALVFVEVKARAPGGLASPEEAVDSTKREHLRRVAWNYARRAGVDWDRVRFDIVSVILSSPPRLQLFRGAFSSRER
ncbi:MAG: YraN family protein [Bryobacteraceae bacterium]